MDGRFSAPFFRLPAVIFLILLWTALSAGPETAFGSAVGPGAPVSAGAPIRLSPPTGTLTGTVTDGNGAPLGGVTVRILHTLIPSAQTNGSGSYTITDIPAGNGYDAICGLLPTYAPVWRPFAIQSGQVTVEDASLPDAMTFESGQGVFTGEPPWQWGTPSGVGPPGAFSGTKCWGTNISGNYPDGANAGLTSPTLDPTGLPGLYLGFTGYYETQAGFDGGNVQVSMNGGAWITVAPVGGYPTPAVVGLGSEPGWSGSSGGWQPAVLDLSPYRLSHLRIRFHFGSDSSVNAPGWYVDDVAIYLTNSSTGVGGFPPSAASAHLLPARPNPFREASTLGFRVPSGAASAQLLICDAAGRLIRDLYNGPASGGALAIRWDGMDSAGKPVPAGCYYYSLEADGRFVGSQSIVRVR